MMVVAFTLSQQSWACGCLRKDAPKSMAPFMLSHQIPRFQYAATARPRCLILNAASGYRVMHTNRKSQLTVHHPNRKLQRMASSQSRSEPSDAGSDTEADGEEDDDDEEASAGQTMFEENLEIMVRAAMNLFTKYSARAIRAIREIAPPAISTELISFGVKGALSIGTMWVFKALLEVFCSTATYVFAGLLVARMAWSVLVCAQPGGDSS